MVASPAAVQQVSQASWNQGLGPHRHRDTVFTRATSGEEVCEEGSEALFSSSFPLQSPPWFRRTVLSSSVLSHQLLPILHRRTRAQVYVPAQPVSGITLFHKTNIPGSPTVLSVELTGSRASLVHPEDPLLSLSCSHPSSHSQALSPAVSTNHIVLLCWSEISMSGQRRQNSEVSFPVMLQVNAFKYFHIVLSPESRGCQPCLTRVLTQKCSPRPSHTFDSKVHLVPYANLGHFRCSRVLIMTAWTKSGKAAPKPRYINMKYPTKAHSSHAFK